MRQCLASIWIAFLFVASLAFAQDSALVEQYKRSLMHQPDQKSGAMPGKGLRALGGVTTASSRENDAAGEPSVTMHLEFKFNSDELTPQTVKYLDALGTALQDPQLRCYLYRVEGHTDNVGNDAYNSELSRRRALSVVDYMVKTFGLEREQFEVQGFGKRKPVASNETEEGGQQNRRVVIANTLKRFEASAVERPKLTVKVKCSRGKVERDLEDDETLTQRDNYAIEVIPKTSAYVYIYQIDSMGHATLVFPNSEYSQSSNNLEPGRLYRVPDFGKWFFLDTGKGREHIVVVAQKEDIKDPMKVCRKVLGIEQQTVVASAKERSSVTAATGTTRGLGGTREDNSRTVAGMRPDRPVEASSDATAKPPSPSPPPEDPIDMNKVFVWQRSFMHQ